MAISRSPGNHLSLNILRYLQKTLMKSNFDGVTKVFEVLFAQSMSQIICDSIMKLYSVFIVYKYWISNIFQAIDAKVSCNSNMLKLVRDKQKCSSGLLSEDDACFFLVFPCPSKRATI